ncbi:MAG TPA: hypothetical protein VGV59_08460 [Pyrinomonadaceae bacterium]|nr:hypothetical protein [Pyrinomonadaceae bacterium]
MKHRSVVISAVFVMLMVVGPQAAQQFSALKEAAGNRLQAGIWNVFLSYHAQRIESPEQGQRTPEAAACDLQMADASTRPARQTKKNAAVVEAKNEAEPARRESKSTEEFDTAFDFAVAANVKEIEGLDRVGEKVLKEIALPVTTHDMTAAPVAWSKARVEAAWSFADEAESVRRELKKAEQDKDAARRLVKATERALRAKTAAGEMKVHQLDVLKVINFDALREHDSHLKARGNKVRPRVVLRASKPIAPGTRLAPTPPASVIAC